MGLFSSLKNMANESNGNAIYTELHHRIEQLHSFEPEIISACLLAFYYRVKDQERELLNLPDDVKISTGKYLQSEGRRLWEENVINGASQYFAGAWLESHARPGQKAAEARRVLSDFLATCTKSVEQNSD